MKISDPSRGGRPQAGVPGGVCRRVLRGSARAILLLVLAGTTLPGSGAATAGSAVVGGGDPPSLLLYDSFGKSPCPTPAFMRDNQGFLQGLPFDGVAVYLRRPDLSDDVTASAMTNRPLGHTTIARVLAPLRGLALRSMTQNFALVHSHKPPDFFNDWSIVLQNFSDLARAARDAGLKGVFFDNTNYSSPWANYPAGVEYPARPLKEYQFQARLRGRQVMEAMATQFPDIVVLSVHGAYLSEAKAPPPSFPQWQAANALTGPFFCGFAEGAGKRTVCVDGGALYSLRTLKEFEESYDWRKNAIVSDKINSGFIPPALRRLWPSKVSFAFGLSALPFAGREMAPWILRPTLSQALKRTDRYVWIGVEGTTFLLPPQKGGADASWMDAVRHARMDLLRKGARP